MLRGLGTAPAQAVALRPTVFTLWIGNNDVLSAVVQGRAIDGVTLTPAAAFRAAYAQIVTALRARRSAMVVANVPDVTTIPFVTTIPPVVVNPATGQPVLVDGSPVPLIGPNGPLAPGDARHPGRLHAAGAGRRHPHGVGGRGTPLPDEVILDPGEVAVIQDHVRANNPAIREVCAGAGIPVLDLEHDPRRASPERPHGGRHQPHERRSSPAGSSATTASTPPSSATRSWPTNGSTRSTETAATWRRVDLGPLCLAASQARGVRIASARRTPFEFTPEGLGRALDGVPARGPPLSWRGLVLSARPE